MSIAQLPPPDPGPDTWTPPHDDAAEAATIGAILHGDPRVIDDILAIVKPSDFYRPAHEDIATAAQYLYSRGEPVDPAPTYSPLSYVK